MLPQYLRVATYSFAVDRIAGNNAFFDVTTPSACLQGRDLKHSWSTIGSICYPASNRSASIPSCAQEGRIGPSEGGPPGLHGTPLRGIPRDTPPLRSPLGMPLDELGQLGWLLHKPGSQGPRHPRPVEPAAVQQVPPEVEEGLLTLRDLPWRMTVEGVGCVRAERWRQGTSASLRLPCSTTFASAAKH
jgi:hypothetical protein